MPTISEELVSNILETRYEVFSDELVADAKKRIIDVIGCAIGGANASGNAAIIDLVREWNGKKEATVLVHGDRVTAHDAAMVNSIMCRSYDYEVCGPELEGKAAGRMSGHICGTTECTALAVAEQKASNGKELITAIILGGDMASRIASAEDYSFDHSFDASGTVNGFGATAVAGRLWSLSEKQMLNALGIVVNQLAGSFQSILDGVHTFKLYQGLSARNGIISVELASKNFTGIKDPLMSRHGYFSRYCKSYRPELVTTELGKRFYTKGAHKLYPGCYANHAAIECGLELHRQHHINPEDIVEVTVSIIPMLCNSFLNQPFKAGDTQMKASFNLPYNVANVLLRKSTRLEHFTTEFLQDPKVINLAKKVKIVPTMTPPKNGWAQKAWATDLRVKMKDGSEFSAYADAPKGRLLYPLGSDEIKNKFRNNVAFSGKVSSKKAEEAITMLDTLEEVNDVTKIFKLLTL